MKNTLLGKFGIAPIIAFAGVSSLSLLAAPVSAQKARTPPLVVGDLARCPPQPVKTWRDAQPLFGSAAPDYAALLNERDYPQAVFDTLDRLNKNRPINEQVLLFSLQDNLPTMADEYQIVVTLPPGMTGKTVLSTMESGLDRTVSTAPNKNFPLRFSAYPPEPWGIGRVVPYKVGQVLSPRTKAEGGAMVRMGAKALTELLRSKGSVPRAVFAGLSDREDLRKVTNMVAAKTDEFDVIVSGVHYSADGKRGYIRYSTLYNGQNLRLLGNSVGEHVLHGSRIYGYESNADGTTTIFIRGLDQWAERLQISLLNKAANSMQADAWLSFLADAGEILVANGGTIVRKPERSRWVVVNDPPPNLDPPARYRWTSEQYRTALEKARQQPPPGTTTTLPFR